MKHLSFFLYWNLFIFIMLIFCIPIYVCICIYNVENNYIVPPLPHSEVAHIEKAREEQMVVLYRDTALELIHNSFRTNLCLKQTTNYIAIAATYLTTLRLKLKPPCGNPRDVENQWFEILYEYLKCKKFTRSVMVEICSDILDCIEFRCHAQGEGQTHPHSIDLVGIEELRNQLNTLLTFHREIDAKELKSNVVFSNSTMSSISMSVSNTDNSAGTDISTNMKLIYKETRSNTVSTDAAAQNANTENSEESRKSLQQSGVDNSSSAGVSAYEKGTSDSVGVSSVSGQSSSEVTNTPSVSTETVNPPSKHDFNGKAMASTPTPPPPPPPPDTEYCTSEARCDNNGVYANVECEHNAKYVSESSHTKRSQQSVELDMLPPPPPPPDTPVLEPFSNTATPINTATASTNIKLIPTAGITSICNGAAM